MKHSIDFSLVLLVTVIPIYFINKWLKKITRPRESSRGFLLYFILSLALIFLYTFLFIFLLARFYPLPKK